MDTIFALATARGKSGVAIVRISGPQALTALTHFKITKPQPRKSTLARLQHDGQTIDQALVLYFNAPASFTGEDVVELHLHGAPAIINAVLTNLAELPEFRSADPGEFTRRALENERLDLAQVEGLSDLIEAETEAQRKQAMAVFSGELGSLTESWRSNLIRAAALLEATIDFADEEVPVDVTPEVTALLRSVISDLEKQVAGVTAAERIRDGFEVAIVGPPNAGKSSLLNALAGRVAAITSRHAGTTRDVIEVRMDLRGLPVTLLDTAGLREATSEVEGEGIERAKQRAELADLRLILRTNNKDAPAITPQNDDIVATSKSDLGEGDFSAKTGDGLSRLTDRITTILENRATNAGLAIRERHRIAMITALGALESAQDRLHDADLSEIVAEDIRSAIRALDMLVGRVDVENLLDEIFSSFCIGK